MGETREVLTLEERLDRTLVRDGQQPYRVPDNWVWTRLGAVASFTGGGTPSKKNKSYWEGSIPWASVKDIKGQFLYSTEDHITELGVSNSSTNICPSGGLILITRMNPGKPIITRIETAINQDLKIVKSHLPNLFLYYYFMNIQQTVITKSRGSTVKGITLSSLNSIEFPLPPLAEQHRIVTRIESLFSKLDRARELAQNALDSFENRRAAILYRAFTGELTKKWRDEVGVRFDSWDTTSLVKIVDSFKYGTSAKSEYGNSGIPVIRIPNISDGTIGFEDIKYLKDTDVGESSCIRENDILVIRSNGSRELVGKCALVPCLEKPFAYASYLIRIRPTAKIFSRFLLNYLKSSVSKSQLFNRAKSSVGINNINSKELGSIQIILPTLPEQIEIVHILDSVFEKEAQAKELAGVIEKISLMKKVILGGAFRGELGTNDPQEEGSMELLTSILEKN